MPASSISGLLDHSWLLLPGGLPQAELPDHLTEIRKGGWARLRTGSHADQQGFRGDGIHTSGLRLRRTFTATKPASCTSMAA